MPRPRPVDGAPRWLDWRWKVEKVEKVRKRWKVGWIPRTLWTSPTPGLPPLPGLSGPPSRLLYSVYLQTGQLESWGADERGGTGGSGRAEGGAEGRGGGGGESGGAEGWGERRVGGAGGSGGPRTAAPTRGFRGFGGRMR